MTMHVVLGDGEMTRKELTETMTDLWKTDEDAGNTFWFLLQGKSEPTDTDKALVTWLEKNDIYYEIITDDAANVDAIYSQPQEVHEAKRLSSKILSLLTTKPEEGETAELLTLFVDNDTSSAEADRWLNDVASAVYKEGIMVRAMNDGLIELDLTEEAAAAEAEPEASKSAAKKAPTKAVAKAQPKLAVVKDKEPEVEPDTPVSQEGRTLTRAALEELDLSELKALAAEKGITLPPKTRMPTYIDAILGEGKDTTPVAEVSNVGEPASLNGSLDVEALADAIVLNVIKRLEAALS